MTALPFLSTRAAPLAGFAAVARSPLARVLPAATPGVVLTDLSLALAKFEVRGELTAPAAGELIPIAPRRALVVVPAGEAEPVEAELRAGAETVVDRTGALAGLRLEGAAAATLLRRLTDLDLDRLPAAGAVARVRAIVRGGGSSFELYWPQEYGHYLAGVVVDAAQGLRA